MIALVLHVWGKPFLASSLQQLEAAGLVTCWFTMWCGLLFYQDGVSPTMRVFLTIVIVLVNVVYSIVIVCFLMYHTLKEQKTSTQQCACLNRFMEYFGGEEDCDEGVEMMNPSLEMHEQAKGVKWRRHYSIEHSVDFYENPMTGETTWGSAN